MRVAQLIEVILMPRERTVEIVDFHSKFFDLKILGITKLIFFRKLFFQCAHLSCQENLLASQCCIVFLEFFQLLLTLSVLLPFRLSQLCLQRVNLIVFCLELILLLLKLNLESITFLFKLIDFLRQALPFGPILLHFFAICAHYCSSRLWRPTSAKLFLSLILRQIILLLRLCLTTFPRSVEILFLLELLLHFHDIGCHRFELSFIYIQYLLCLGSTFHNCSELIIKCASQRCNSALVVLILAICLFLLNDLHRSSMAVVESFFNSLHLCLQQTLQRLQWD